MKIHFVDDNDILLVITPRQSDSQIVKSLNSQKVYFKTWHEIAAKLNQINKDFENKSIIISDFIEYGQITGEFENMSEIEEKELSAYIKTKVMKTEEKIFAIFAKAFNEINFENYNIRNAEYKTSDNWGRMGIEIVSNKKNDYGQWFFLGIYYKTYDHGIPFKKLDTPEIAFFLDITPQSRTELIKDKALVESLNKLKHLGFENNLTEQITPNNWRFLFKRVPLTEFKNLNVDSCKNFINEIFTDLYSEKYFLKKFF